MRSTGIASLLILLAASGIAAAEESHAFKAGLETGDRIQERITTRFDIFLTPKGEEGFQVGLRTEEASDTRVVQAENGAPRRIERGFSKRTESRESSALSGLSTREAFGHGKTFLLERTAEGLKAEMLGSSAEAEFSLPPEIRERLEGDLAQAHLKCFPSEPVAPGYEWKKSGPVLAALVPDLPASHVREGGVEFRFKEVVKTDGKNVAVIEVTSFTLALDGGPDGARLNLVGKGEIRFGLDRGIVLSLELKGTLRLAEPVGPLNGEGSFEIDRKATVTKG